MPGRTDEHLLTALLLTSKCKPLAPERPSAACASERFGAQLTRCIVYDAQSCRARQAAHSSNYWMLVPPKETSPQNRFRRMRGTTAGQRAEG
eukprot:scaffold154992_cov30-Tisochrysis_lutea.AAC.4